MGSAADRLIVALDSRDLPEAVKVARRLRGLIRCVKIGSALFTAAGPVAIQRMRALGLDVMLDLKFHDIPSTVEKSCRAAVHHRVAMLTVHASGERRMLEAAVAGVKHESARLRIAPPRVIGVTVLTSVNSSSQRLLRDRAVKLAIHARHVGLDGVVASAWEAAAIRRRVGKQFVIICPGIRLLGVQASDQKRIASPQEAIARGADFLVVGRPVTEAKDPRRMVQRILTEMEAQRERC